jgi:uncharacterized protein
MNIPHITLTTASLCALFQFALTCLVITRRVRVGVRFMQGHDDALLRRMRAHGNLTESAPIVLVLMLMLELSGLASVWLVLAGAVFVIGRVIHALGLITDRSPWGRQVGMLATLLVMSSLAVAGLFLGFSKLV